MHRHTSNTERLVLRYLVAERRLNECLGCGRSVRPSRWLSHSQSCPSLERIVEIAEREALDMIPQAPRSACVAHQSLV